LVRQNLYFWIFILLFGFYAQKDLDLLCSKQANALRIVMLSYDMKRFPLGGCFDLSSQCRAQLCLYKNRYVPMQIRFRNPFSDLIVWLAREIGMKYQVLVQPFDADGHRRTYFVSL
jgi:hypothetical protein